MSPLLDAESRWAAQWAWMHQYYRGKGILTNAWGKFHVKWVLCWQPLDKREGLTCARCDERHKKRQVEQNAAGDEAN